MSYPYTYLTLDTCIGSIKCVCGYDIQNEELMLHSWNLMSCLNTVFRSINQRYCVKQHKSEILCYRHCPSFASKYILKDEPNTFILISNHESQSHFICSSSNNFNGCIMFYHNHWVLKISPHYGWQFWPSKLIWPEPDMKLAAFGHAYTGMCHEPTDKQVRFLSYL